MLPIRLILALTLLVAPIPGLTTGAFGPSGPYGLNRATASCMTFSDGCCCETVTEAPGSSCCSAPVAAPAPCLCDHDADDPVAPQAPAPDAPRTSPATIQTPIAPVPAGAAVPASIATTSPARPCDQSERRALLCIWTI